MNTNWVYGLFGRNVFFRRMVSFALLLILLMLAGRVPDLAVASNSIWQSSTLNTIFDRNEKSGLASVDSPTDYSSEAIFSPLLVPLSFDQVVFGTIEMPGQEISYTFSGTSGDQVLIDVVSTSSNLIPRFRVYRPNGTSLCTGGTGDRFIEKQCTLDSSGTHTILVGEWGDDDTGTFNLYIKRTNNPANPIIISFDETRSGVIDPIVDMDAYTFSGVSGDQILINAITTSGNFIPRFRVYRPNGTALCSGGTGDTFIEKQCTLDNSGVHTILVGDWGGNDTGSFNLYVQRTNNPANPTPTPFCETQSGMIEPVVEMDAYTFSGTTGDQVLISIGGTSGNFIPRFRVYRPNGTALCSGGTGDTFIEKQCTLDSSGVHTILVGDWGGDDTGSFNLHISRGTCPASADLALTKTDTPDPITVGNTLTYLLTVINNGPSPATGVTLVDTLPTGATFLSTTPSQGSCSRVGNTITCDLGTLANGVSATVTIRVMVTTSGTISNMGSVTGNESDPNLANNTATANTTVNGGVECTPTIQSAGSGDWNVTTTWNPNRIPNSSDVVLIRVGHTVSGSASAHVQTLCNYGILQSKTAQSLQIKATGSISNYGQILGSDGAAKTGDGCGNWGRNIQLKALGNAIYNEGIIQAGAGGDGGQCGGNGGSTYVLGRNVTNHKNGIICAGKGGNVLNTIGDQGGNGGETHIRGNLDGSGFLVNEGLTCGGDGGNGNAGATKLQQGGDGGCLYLNASNVYLNNGQHRAGRGGQGTGGGNNGQDGCVVIDPNTISLSGSNTRVSGGDITISGGYNWVLDLKNMNNSAVSATNDIILSVGTGGVVDLRGNSGRVLQAGGQVIIRADNILLDNNVDLTDVVGANSVTGAGQILYNVSLAGPGQLTGQSGMSIPIDLIVFNNGPIPDTYILSWSDMAGWNLGSLPSTISIGGLDLSELTMNISLPSTAISGETNIITVTATSQADPSISAMTQFEVLVGTKGMAVYLPLVIKN